VDGGVVVRLYGNTAAGDYSFDSVYWTQDVYEKSARAGGMLGKLEWIPFRVPEEMLKENGQATPGGASLAELKSYAEAEYCAFLRITKS
jgi:hypothetical protein